MTLTVSVWVRKAEDSGRGEPVRKKVCQGEPRGNWARNEQREEGMAVRVGPETIDEFRVKKNLLSR